MERIVVVVRPQQCLRFQVVAEVIQLVQSIAQELSVVVLRERWLPPVGKQVSALTGDLIETSLEEMDRELTALEQWVEKEIAALRKEIGVPVSLFRASVRSELAQLLARPSMFLEFALPVAAEIGAVLQRTGVLTIGCLLPRQYLEEPFLQLLADLARQLQRPVVCLSDADPEKQQLPAGVHIVRSSEPLTIAAVQEFLQTYRPTFVLVPKALVDEQVELRTFLQTQAPVPVVFVSEQ